MEKSVCGEFFVKVFEKLIRIMSFEECHSLYFQEEMVKLN